MAKLYLIPTPLSETDRSHMINRDLINSLDYFVVENLRTARRFLATLSLDRKIDEMTFVELSEHTDAQEVESMVRPIIDEGRSCGVMSEAGLPCVADPGHLLVGAAHRHGVEIVPLVGGSSIMLSLMASGAWGQNFAFNGYLPIKSVERAAAIKRLEREMVQSGRTQIFIETPYRNLSLFNDLLRNCMPTTKLSVSTNLTGDKQFTASRSVAQWRNCEAPKINKLPTVFVIFQ